MHEKSRPKAAPQTPTKASEHKATAPKGLRIRVARCPECDGRDSHTERCPIGRRIARAFRDDERYFREHPDRPMRDRRITRAERWQIEAATGRRAPSRVVALWAPAVSAQLGVPMTWSGVAVAVHMGRAA